ncbi:MAG: deoxynucleoside kinase [Anaerolineae bacterium]|nr:deoxynucleoside kinase [Anaerolineae bacterium]
MGKLVIVMGNSGVGKTTLTNLLCSQGGFISGLEKIGERPFQSRFAGDLARYALPNQFDFLLFRIEQEMAIRQAGETGILDGGLEQDFYVFTRQFLKLGYLNEDEYHLCERLVLNFRRVLAPPDLIIRLNAPLETICERYRRRNRALEITRIKDLTELQYLLDDWFSVQTQSPVVNIDVSQDDPTYYSLLPGLLSKIREMI